MRISRVRSRNALLVTALFAGGVSLSGCATEQYVDEHIAEATAATNARIDGVDHHVSAVERMAQDAMQRADAANSAAQAAASAAEASGSSAQAASSSAQRANAKIDEMEPILAHIEEHHLHQTWRDVTGRKPGKRHAAKARAHAKAHAAKHPAKT
jgi:outer membrane murein-binding lipoprotein Lpp